MKMKTDDLLLLGGLGFLAYKALTNKTIDAGPGVSSPPPAAATYYPVGTVTPGGNVLTQDVDNVQQGVDYINKTVLNKSASSASTVLPSGAIVVPRSGGGYTQVGAIGVTLNNTPIKQVTPGKTITIGGKTYAVNN